MTDCPSSSKDEKIYLDVAKERKRQNEVYKYLSSTTSAAFSIIPKANTSGPFVPTAAQLSRDPVLNGLSQLGALQLACDRSFISLLDSGHQYIIAETTRSTSLYPGNQEELVPTVAFGAGAIDMSMTVCLNTLPTFVHTDGSFNIETPNVSASPTQYLIRDFTEHEYFKARPYVTGWPYMRFYYEVPLLSPSGLVVGSYCVVHNEKKPDPTSRDLKLMQEIAASIVQHLEHLRIHEEHMRAARLLKGLDLFVQGEGSVRQWYLDHYTSETHQNRIEPRGQRTTRQIELSHNHDHDLDPLPLSQSASDGFTSTGSLGNLSHISAEGTSATSSLPLLDESRKPTQPSFPFLVQEPFGSDAFSGIAEGLSGPQSIGEGSDLQDAYVHDELRATFSRATNLLRESLDLEGVFCFDGCPRSFASLVTNVPSNAERDSGSETNDDTTSGDQAPRSFTVNSNVEYSTADCFGFSTRGKSSLANNVLSSTHYRVPERKLQYLIQKYPSGQIFHFDDSGILSPSEDSSGQDEIRKKYTQAQRRKNPSRVNDEDLQNWFPAARAIIFLPLWAAKSQTCMAACFGWSTEATRKFSLEDLTYFTTFGRSITAEVTRLDMLSSDRAKSDFISSVSHELRSPLHGILGSAEMLQEICSEPRQTRMISMIQNCGVSLLETMNHILDYTKINTLFRNYGPPHTRNMAHPAKEGVIERLSDFDMGTLVEEVVETSLIAHRFKQSTTSSYSLLGMQDKQHTETEISNKVPVILAIDWKDNWLVNSEAGAWRRILINLLGNALKYTSKGHIKVSLQHAQMGMRTKNYGNRLRNLITLSVKDTGKGISTSYLQKHLFQPFAQEDVLSSGTGLGLSIVKQLVDSLGGKIEISTEVGSGTEIIVSAPLYSPSPIQVSGQPHQSLPARNGERKAYFLGMDAIASATGNVFDDTLSTPSESARTMLTLRSALASHLGLWFNASVTSASTVDDACTDLVVLREEYLQLLPLAEREKLLHRPTGGTIIILPDHDPASATDKLGDSVQFLRAPYGPRQLSKILETLSPKLSPSPGAPSKPTLPLAPPHVGKPVMSTQERTVDSPNSPVSRSVLPITVLLVDDNPINLKILVMYMTKLKIGYITATNGLEAVEAYQASAVHIDYILMDISMPVMDGLTATRHIRALESSSKRKPSIIAALTGLGSTQAQQKAYSSGIDIYLAKPVAMKTIGELISGGGEVALSNRLKALKTT